MVLTAAGQPRAPCVHPGPTATTAIGVLAFTPGTRADRTRVGIGTRVRALAAAEENELPRLSKGYRRGEGEARANYGAVRAR